MQQRCDVQFRVYYHMDFLFKAKFKNKNMYNLRTIKLIRDIWHEYNFLILIRIWWMYNRHCLPWWLRGRESAYQCRRHGIDLWSGKNPGGRNGNPLQYSCLETPMDREAWHATVHMVKKSWTWQVTAQHSTHADSKSSCLTLLVNTVVRISNLKSFTHLWTKNTLVL